MEMGVAPAICCAEMTEHVAFFLPLPVLQLIFPIPEAAASGIFLSGKGENGSKFLEKSELLTKGLASSLFSGIIAGLTKKKQRLSGNFLPEKSV